MWSCEYDEDLNKNQFFQAIFTDHSDILRKASQENWLICVPRADSVNPEDLAIETILDHILVPSSQRDNNIGESQFSTLSKKTVTVKKQHIHVQDRPTKILFEETFYIGGTKCAVLCLQRPLFSTIETCDDHVPHTLETLHDCIDFLWSENFGQTLAEIQKVCDDFKCKLTRFHTENLQSQRDLIGNLYSQCLQISLKNRDLPQDNFILKLKISVETYMQSCLECTLIHGINTSGDGVLNKIIRNSSDVLLKDLNISNKFCDIITCAKSELSKINNYCTSLDKINCLKTTFTYFYSSHKKICVTSDEVLQILIFLILKSNVTNWISNLTFLTQFTFSSLNEINENSFLITTLEAAIEFIKNKNVKCHPEFDDKSEISQTILNNQFVRFKGLLNYKIKSDKTDERELINLCHPLCDCDQCSDVKYIDSSQDNINHINNNGQNLLIIATLLGRLNFVEYLLNLGSCDVNYQDYYGKAALHYANINGFQDILLILVNSKSDVNLKDNDENTPLHLSCNNGHENCVKALLYSSKNIDVNATNNHGETPLHLSVKNSFLEITKILLENQASTSVLNKKQQTVFDLSQNYNTDQLLCSFDNNLKTRESKVSDSFIKENSRGIVCLKAHGTRPQSLYVIKKIDLLLKAIENNDFPLTCFYLGFSSNADSYDWKSKCHPLCNCDKCCEDSQDNCDQVQERLNVNYCNIDGFTPLHIAAKFGRVEILRILLDSQALVNLKTYKTLQTSLHLACIYQKLNVVKELVNCPDCEIDCQDYKGNTPLYYACIKNDTRIVEILLKNGASADVKNYLGQSVIKEVQEKRLFGMSKLLKTQQSVDFEDIL